MVHNFGPVKEKSLFGKAAVQGRIRPGNVLGDPGLKSKNWVWPFLWRMREWKLYMDLFGDDFLPEISLLSKGQKIWETKDGKTNGLGPLFKWFEAPVFGEVFFFVAATSANVFLFALFLGRR